MNTRSKVLMGGLLTALLVFGRSGFSQTTSRESPAQQVLNQAATTGQFTFIVFYKDDSPITRQMVQTTKAGVAAREGRATFVAVQVKDPAEDAVVKKFDVGRAPMPMMMAVAPNGAITGVFSKQVKDAHIEEAIVTPTMATCMKSLQANKLIVLSLQNSGSDTTPAFAAEMLTDPAFSNRLTLVSMDIHDPKETEFLKQLQVDPKQVQPGMSVVLAPPGVLVGKYDAAATKDQVAGAIHQAGKCCNDPHCKHNHGSSHQATQPNTTRRK